MGARPVNLQHCLYIVFSQSLRIVVTVCLDKDAMLLLDLIRPHLFVSKHDVYYDTDAVLAAWTLRSMRRLECAINSIIRALEYQKEMGEQGIGPLDFPLDGPLPPIRVALEELFWIGVANRR